MNAQGKKTSVLLSLKQYQKLLDDLHDLAVIAERRDEEPISLEEMQRRLQRNDGGIALPSSRLSGKICAG